MVIKRFVNSPVPSNTYVIEDEVTMECVVIDPGTKGGWEIIDYIRNKGLSPKYILLTHGDFDHVWGVNSIKEAFHSIQIVASKETARIMSIPKSYFSALYFEKPEPYSIDKVDCLIDDNGNQLVWHNYSIRFIQTPGHTSCSNVILFDDLMFSGDSILKDAKPLVQKRHGGDKETFKTSIKIILDSVQDEMMVYPGHGEVFRLGQVREFYRNYLNV